MAETNDYDTIFAALKHPIRRQILLLLEEKGEVSFTEIQNAVGVDDTGLLSYHLKELATLVEQSARGKYGLSEVGQASIALFRKVEREKQATEGTVQRYFEKVFGEIVFLFFIIGATLMAPLSVDIYLSVQAIHSGLPTEQLALLFPASLLIMLFCSILFIFYDRHYFSKNAKTNAVHSLFFAAGISLTSLYSAYINRRFEINIADSNSLAFWFSVLRTLSFLGATPIIAYEMSKFLNRR